MSASRHLWGFAALAAFLPMGSLGCRADVEGDWEGHIGDPPACLSLTQDGSTIRGEVCVNGDCDSIGFGQVEEENLSIHYGRESSAFVPPTRLDLVLNNNMAEGYGHLEGCPCTPDNCDCRIHVRLERVGACYP